MLKDVLRTARTNKNLKQEDVANAVKVSKQTYLKWENGATEPKASQIQELSKVLDISPNEICRGKIYKRYSLDEFILEIYRNDVQDNIETLKAWEHIEDHEAFFNDIRNMDIAEREAFDIEAHNIKEQSYYDSAYEKHQQQEEQ